jgi:chemotaxis protein CheC
MAGAILTVGLLELSQVSDYAIIIDTKINEQEEQKGVQGNFLLIPDPASLTKLFHALGITEYD